MTDILFTANGASATALVSGELTSGMVGLPVRFSFDSDWDGLNIVAVFDGGGQRISVPLLTDMEAVLPWEVIVKANTRLRIGAEGRKSDGSVVIPTVWANAGYIKEGAVATDDLGNPPTPGIYDQIMAAIEAGKLQGKPGDDGVSPIVSITDISGGHRVTITDAIGAKTFDVMNGKDGSDASVSIVDNLGSSDPNAALSARMGGVLKTKIEDDVSALNEQLQPQINQRVKTVNGVAPDKNGNVEIEVSGGEVTDEQVSAAVSAWLDEHPEATTTVEDGSISTAKMADGAVTYDKMDLYTHSESIILFDPSQHTAMSSGYIDIGKGSGLLKEMITNGFIAVVENANGIFASAIKISANGSKTRNINTALDGYTVTREPLKPPTGSFTLNGKRLGVARFTYTPTDALTDEWTADALDLSHNFFMPGSMYILKNCDLTQEMIDNGFATLTQINSGFSKIVKTVMGEPVYENYDFSALEGKYGLHIGDSYTAAMCNQLVGFTAFNEKHGLAGTLNYGIASSSIRDGSNGSGYSYQAMVSRVCHRNVNITSEDVYVPHDLADIGYITFMGGTNDSAGIESSVGTDVYDGASYHIYGAMNQILETLVGAYPDVPIIVILQPPCANNTLTENPEGLDISNLSQNLKSVLVSQRKQKAVKEVAEVFARIYPNVYVVDCCFDWYTPMNADDLATYWSTDLLHLTGSGYDEIVQGTKYDSVFKALCKHFNVE